MKYFIVSQEQLEILISFSTTLGITQNSEQWTEVKEFRIASMIEKLQEGFKEIPDHIDTIVGYSSPNPTHCTLWKREGDKIERMKDDEEPKE